MFVFRRAIVCGPIPDQTHVDFFCLIRLKNYRKFMMFGMKFIHNSDVYEWTLGNREIHGKCSGAEKPEIAKMAARLFSV